jgi:hypothetical protein
VRQSNGTWSSLREATKAENLREQSAEEAIWA